MKLTNQMAPSIHVQNLIKKSETRSRTAYNCDVIQPSFEGNYFQADDFEEFLDSLKICSGKYFYESDILEDFVTFNISAHHNTLWARYITEFPNKFPQDEAVRLRGGALVIGTKIMHDALLFHHHMESTRWKEAISDCKSRLIPSTLVTQSRLNQTLYDMAVKLDDDNLELSIPPEYLSIYFDSPIADCVFTDDALIVHIQAPVKTPADWTLLNVRPLPFYNPETDNQSESICTVGNIGNHFIFDNKSRTAFATECSLGELCHVEEATERPYEKTCATATLLEELDFIPTLCDLKCQPIEYFQLPIFRKLASDRFVITGTPGGQFVIQCPTLKGIQIINFPDIGGVEVELPCGCDILYESVKISARHPCKIASKAEVYHLLPEHWNTDNFNYV